MKYLVLGVMLVALFAINNAYASDNGMVDFPKVPDNNMVGQDVQVSYQSDNRWTLTVTTQFQVNKVIELPDVIYYPGIDGQIYSINLKDGFILANTPYNSQDKIDEVAENNSALESIEERKQEIQEEKDDVWGKYLTCLEEFKEEQPIRFEAWQRTAALTDFEIPDDTIAWSKANFTAEELKAERAWQVCEGIKNYQWIGVYEKNKDIEEDIPWKLDTTDSPLTVPITEDAMKAQEDIAKEFQCSDEGKSRGLCTQEFSGVNRGDKYGYYIPSWYNEWKEQNATPVNKTKAILDAQQALCDNYMILYEHKRGSDQFPQWLSHCPDTNEDEQ